MTTTERQYVLAWEQVNDAMLDITEILKKAAKDCGVE